MPPRTQVSAWRPAVPGVAEVFHAHFVDHAYPSHVHEDWTLLIVDDGAIRYDLARDHHGAVGPTVTVLPPHVPHDGRSATPHGFRKRVLYVDTSVLPESLIGAAVDQPTIADRLLRERLHRLHESLARPGDTLEAESRLAFIADRIGARLGERCGERRGGRPGDRRGLRSTVEHAGPGGTLADRLRQLLDARVVEGLTLRAAADELHAHPAHLVRVFTRQYGLPPHRYLTGRRVERARRLLLAGRPPAQVATAVGFYDQAHLTRQFTRYLGVTPGRYASP